MAGSPKKRTREEAKRREQEEAARNRPQPTIADIPLVKGAEGIDLKLRSVGAAGAYGLTAWTEAGREFLAEHVLTVSGAGIGNEAVWFSDREADIIRDALRRTSLRCVAGIGAEPDPGDMEGFNGWRGRRG